ncbi:LacI family transcriptional regulator [Candidatus Gracilibacteria bacterium]|nr:LacI family transcriptional regulator [Candidatus Gracilibacteria bacterium]
MDITLEQIAKLASVSPATVSRVINNHPNVRQVVRDRVRAVIEQVGYAPNAAARSLATKQTNIIGLVIPQEPEQNIKNDPIGFFTTLSQHIARACSDHNKYLMLSMITPDQSTQFYRDIVRGGHIDGLIVGCGTMEDPVLPVLLGSKIPTVMVGRNPYYPDVYCIDADNFSGAVQAVTHLIERGRRRIATITLSLGGGAGLDRHSGYKRALLQHGFTIDPALIVETRYPDVSGPDAMRRLLQLATPPDAVFLGSDMIALEALAVIRDAGLRVPEDIALVGFDDHPLAAVSTPPLTTVRQPVAAMGRRAVELLLQLLDEDTSQPRFMALPTEFVVRQSS